MYTGLEIDSILKSFGERTILADVYLKCCRGDIIALFGRNGTGKSTLLNIIFGTLKSRPEVYPHRRKSHKRAGFPLRTACLSATTHPLLSLTSESITDSRTLYRSGRQETLFRRQKYYSVSGPPRICEISTGEQRYLEIKTTLFSPAPYILLDEPF